MIGAFPAHNAADSGELARWLRRIGERVTKLTPPGRMAAPVGVNLVVHRSNARLAADLRAVIRGGAEVVVTSVGSPPRDHRTAARRRPYYSPTSPACGTSGGRSRPC